MVLYFVSVLCSNTTTFFIMNGLRPKGVWKLNIFGGIEVSRYFTLSYIRVLFNTDILTFRFSLVSLSGSSIIVYYLFSYSLIYFIWSRHRFSCFRRL